MTLQQPPPMNQIEIADAIVQSASALTAARAGDWERAARDVGALAVQYPNGGIQVLLTGLADTLVAQQCGGHPGPEVVVRALWMDPDLGPLICADDVPRPEIRWAGRFIAARATLDNDQCAALYDSIDSDDEFFRNVSAVLEVVASTLNAIDPS